MQDGETPSVSEVAEAAGVSRATAYRYFPSQAALVQAVVDEGLGPILDWARTAATPSAGGRPARPRSPRIDEFEATFKAALKLSLEQWAQRGRHARRRAAIFKRGHRVELLQARLAPLQRQPARSQFSASPRRCRWSSASRSLIVLRTSGGWKARKRKESRLGRQVRGPGGADGSGCN